MRDVQCQRYSRKLNVNTVCFFKWSSLGCAGRSFRRMGGASGKNESGVKLSLKNFDFFISVLVPYQVVIITEVGDVYVKDEEN